jgi:hypothetical protein
MTWRLALQLAMRQRPSSPSDAAELQVAVDLSGQPAEGHPVRALCQSPACSTSGLVTRVRRAHPASTALTSPASASTWMAPADQH